MSEKSNQNANVEYNIKISEEYNIKSNEEYSIKSDEEYNLESNEQGQRRYLSEHDGAFSATHGSSSTLLGEYSSQFGEGDEGYSNEDEIRNR